MLLYGIGIYELGDLFMFKWVLGLCAALYGTLMLFGEPTPEELAARQTAAPEVVAVTPTQAVDRETQAFDVEEVVAPAIAEAVEPIPPITIERVSAAIQTAPALPEAVVTEILPVATELLANSQTASTVATANPIWRVTAQRVNLRSGPSTSNAVVGQALQDDSAEIIELLPSGWAKVYVLESGTEAYVSAQFLAAP